MTCGCAAHRSQLGDPVVADDDLARRARAALAAAPLPAERRMQIAMEWGDNVFVALGFFAATPPDAYHTELATPFGVTLFEVDRETDGVEVSAGAPQLRRMIRRGQLPRTLGLWLLGSCTGGEVLRGSNGVAVDCPATGPDQGMVWRVWLAEEMLDGDAVEPGGAWSDPRIRGELLEGDKLQADFICQPDGDCLLQDPVHGYVLRMTRSGR